MMQVGPVRMRMRHRLVLVRVAMPQGNELAFVNVGVMTVVVPVPVFVLHLIMLVFVRVAVPEEEEDQRQDEHSRGADLEGRDRLSQHGGRKRHAEEGRAREDHLRPGGPEDLRGQYIENDAEPVGEGAHPQRDSNPGKGSDSARERDTDPQVHDARDETFPERDLRRADPVDQRGEMVVESPAESGAGDEQNRQHARGSPPPM